MWLCLEKKGENIEKAMKNNLRNSLRIHVCKTEIIFYVNTCSMLNRMEKDYE